MLEKSKVISIPKYKKLINNVRKTLLPAPPPFVQWLERMLWLLPSQFHPVQPLPISDVEVVNANNGDYYAMGGMAATGLPSCTLMWGVVILRTTVFLSPQIAEVPSLRWFTCRRV
jgi:hypothetical protein